MNTKWSVATLPRFCFSEIVIIFRNRHKKKKSFETYTTLPGTDIAFLLSGAATP